uniref:Uncharacterized protein n=1 Tax=viral metagenome TaxID=1070528 RepID=A0A6M3KXQ9_9ZZZZ
MAKVFLTPSVACILTSSGSVVGSEGAYVWLGLTGASDTAACVAFYRDQTATAGRELWCLSVASQGPRSTPMVGPFKAGASGIYAQLTGTRASAIVALDE